MKKHIPNLITIGNLLSGCFGIICVFQGNLHWASYWIFIGAVCDFFDGMVARVLHVTSSIGKDLDSLSDMVTFGLLPSFILVKLIEHTNSLAILSYCALLIAVFSAFRLAKFNNDPRQSENFIGVPTPANAIVVATFPLLLYSFQGTIFSSWISNKYFLLGYIAIMSYLLISEIQLFSLKFKSLDFKSNFYQWILIFCTVVLSFWLQYGAALLILFIYIGLSIIKFKIIKL